MAKKVMTENVLTDVTNKYYGTVTADIHGNAVNSIIIKKNVELPATAERSYVIYPGMTSFLVEITEAVNEERNMEWCVKIGSCKVTLPNPLLGRHQYNKGRYSYDRLFIRYTINKNGGMEVRFRLAKNMKTWKKVAIQDTSSDMDCGPDIEKFIVD